MNNALVEVPTGLLSLAASLEKAGIKAGLLDAAALRLPLDKVIEKVRDTNPKVVGISLYSFSFLPAIKYTEEIKKIGEDIIVIWGGPHPTASPEICFEKSKVDIIVLGEGELALTETLSRLFDKRSFEDVKGIAFRLGNSFKLNLPRQRVDNLDSLPLPAYHLLPGLRHYKTYARKSPFMGIMTSRGCPFSCIFCSKSVFENRITMRSPENIIEEIDLLVNKYGIRQIDILDDNFTLERVRVERLLDLIISRNYKICINLQSGIRADKVDEELIKKMKKAGVFKVAFGVESGNKAILKEIKKDLDLNKVLEVSRLARKYGMITVGFFMIGLPGEDKYTLQETIDFAIKMNPHIANFMMTIPFYGTELYEIIKKEGRLLFDTKEVLPYGFYGARAYYELNNLTAGMMLKYYSKAYRQFYLRFTKIADILSSVRSFGEIKGFVQAGLSILFPD